LLIISFLIVLVSGLTIALILLVHDLNHITNDLNYINERTTNAGVTSNLHFGPIQRLTVAMNQTLSKTRQLQQQEYQHEHHLEQMLLNLTHDIKTPLTVATGYVQLIQKRPAVATPTNLQRVLANLSSVNYYLRYLMDFNLIRNKADHLNLESINLSRFLEQELFNFFDELSAKKITVTPEITSNLYLTTDKLLLQRIIQNLVGNWLKYAHTTATVKLTQLDSQHLCLEFTNDTITSNRENVTQQFFTTGDDSRQSLGLGLTIVQSLVTTLGGQFSLTSESADFAVKLTFRTVSPLD